MYPVFEKPLEEFKVNGDPEGSLVTYKSPKAIDSTHDPITIDISASELPDFITKKIFADYFELYID